MRNRTESDTLKLEIAIHMLGGRLSPASITSQETVQQRSISKLRALVTQRPMGLQRWGRGKQAEMKLGKEPVPLDHRNYRCHTGRVTGGIPVC